MNIKELKKIIDWNGWPGTEEAFLIAQHADDDLEFQKYALELIKQTGPLHHIAYLTDRILVNEGKKQIFGTQFRKGKPLPTEKIEDLDELRKQYNLPPMREYKKLFK